MKIHRTEEVRAELLTMTREMADQEEINYRLSENIDRRMVLPALIDAVRQKGPAPDLFAGMLPYVTVYSADQLMANPYFRRIRAVRMEAGRFRFANTHMLRGELFFDREPAAEGYRRINRVGVFDGNLEYPGFYEADRCWMSITPNEIVTMEDSLGKASGRVLTLGLGLGYYAYMAHLKEEVESVTVVEREEEVIRLFRSTLLDQFDYPEKIRIVCQDAFGFLEDMADGEYDYCFADIWQNPLDGMEDYLHVRRLANRFEKTGFDYWIDESFIGCLEQSAALVLQFAFLGEDDAEMYHRPGYAFTKALLSDLEVTCAEDVRSLFGGGIRELLEKI